MQQLEIGLATDVGMVRDHNEDYVQCDRVGDDTTLFIVADGMGGAAAGEVASQIASETTFSAFTASTDGDLRQRLAAAIRAANRAVWERAQRDRKLQGMGTTLTAALLDDARLIVGHVGDTRAYLLRRGVLTQLTTDHSWVSEQVQAGLLTPDQARWHPYRNIITRALGTSVEIEVDTRVETLEPGDILVLCSDGLTGMVGDDDLRSMVMRMAPQEAADRLVEAANVRGGPDNITVVVIRIGGNHDDDVTRPMDVQ